MPRGFTPINDDSTQWSRANNQCFHESSTHLSIVTPGMYVADFEFDDTP